MIGYSVDSYGFWSWDRSTKSMNLYILHGTSSKLCHSKGYVLPCAIPEARYAPEGLGLNRLKCRGKSPTFLGDSPIATFEGLLTNIFSGSMQIVRLYATPGPEGTSTGFTLLHRTRPKSDFVLHQNRERAPEIQFNMHPRMCISRMR